MDLICELNDENVLGTGGRSGAAPRYTARAILKNRDGKYAVMYAKRLDFYSLPGGGLEEGESPIEALRRELLEETGCECGSITELGIVKENRAALDFTQISYFYAVEALAFKLTPEFTRGERINGTSVIWCDLDEVVRLISTPKHTKVQRKYLQARDLAALNEYKRRFAERG